MTGTPKTLQSGYRLPASLGRDAQGTFSLLGLLPSSSHLPRCERLPPLLRGGGTTRRVVSVGLDALASHKTLYPSTTLREFPLAGTPKTLQSHSVRQLPLAGTPKVTPTTPNSTRKRGKDAMASTLQSGYACQLPLAGTPKVLSSARIFLFFAHIICHIK